MLGRGTDCVFPSLSPSTGEDARGGQGTGEGKHCAEALLAEDAHPRGMRPEPGHATLGRREVRGGHAMWTALP